MGPIGRAAARREGARRPVHEWRGRVAASGRGPRDVRGVKGRVVSELRACRECLRRPRFRIDAVFTDITSKAVHLRDQLPRGRCRKAAGERAAGGRRERLLLSGRRLIRQISVRRLAKGSGPGLRRRFVGDRRSRPLRGGHLARSLSESAGLREPPSRVVLGGPLRVLHAGPERCGGVAPGRVEFGRRGGLLGPRPAARAGRRARRGGAHRLWWLRVHRFTMPGLRPRRAERAALRGERVVKILPPFLSDTCVLLEL
mmetsp:Transcript_4339/g.10878  ORF Transcript_4339/g.10878 Transcript_4339/m.10878 type:complete len:257 (-) Transcript_4339:22-792(-)